MGAAALALDPPETPRPAPAPYVLETGLIGDALVKLRMARHLTVKAAAKRSGIFWRRLSEIERGLKSPTLEDLDALGAAYGVDPEPLGDLRKGRSTPKTPPPPFVLETGLVGDALVMLRMARNLSLKEAAIRSELFWRRLSAIEHGEMPTDSDLIAVGIAYGVDPEPLGDLRPGRSLPRTRPDAGARGVRQARIPDGLPGAAHWDAAPFARDRHAQAAAELAEEAGGLDVTVIAELTGWSVRTVQKALVRGLAKVRRAAETEGLR